MKASELLSKPDAEVDLLYVAMCPLECGLVRLYRDDSKDRTFWREMKAPLVYQNHRGTHPQSTKCHWSGQPVFKDPVVHFLGEAPNEVPEVFIRLAEPERKIHRAAPIPIRRPRLLPLNVRNGGRRKKT